MFHHACGVFTKLVVCLTLSMVLADAANAATRSLVFKSNNTNDQKRIALVIGNNDYQEVPKLANPVNDARDIAEALSKLGFEVTEVTNATQKEMNRAISQFGVSLDQKTVALFYFAGHGLQMKGKNYLVPVDAQITGEASIPSETVDMDAVLAQLESSTLSIVILDACRNNPFQKARSIGAGGLAQMEAPKGSFIAYATAPGKTAADGSSGNGLYTRELLKKLQTPGISLEEVFKRVRVDVAKATFDAQIPWESTSLTGNFYFNGKPSQTPLIDPAELAMWDSIKSSTNPADFDSYLAKYPNGQFVAPAKSVKKGLEDSIKRHEEQLKQLAIAKTKIEQDEKLRAEERKKLLEQEAKLRAEERKNLDEEKALLEARKKETALREQQLEKQLNQDSPQRQESPQPPVRVINSPNF